MTKPITIPNTFAAATSAIPLSQLDQDFSTLANSTNDLATYSNYVADTGAANAFIANYPANINTSSLTTGLRLQFKAANANTGASTLNVQVNGGSIGTAAIRLTDGSALPANTIVAGAMVDVMYDGTNFQLMNDPSGGQEVITNLTLSGNLTVTGTSTFTGNVTANVANTTTSTITNLSSGNVTITGGTISNVTLDNVTVDVETFSNITINGTATFAAGTVSAPSITTSGDTNTGIYFPAADTIAFTEGGVESMRIDSSGNVGIGTSSPAHRLSVVEDTNGFSRISFTNANAGTSAAAFMYAITSGNRYLGMIVSGANRTGTTAGLSNSSLVTLEAGTDSSAFLLNQAANNPMVFATNGNERMRIDSSGRVMINTTSSDYYFRVNGNSHFGDGYDSGGYGFLQVTRPDNQGTAFHLAFVRQGNAVAGMGFLNNSSTFAIQNAGNNAGNGVTLTIGATSWGTTSDERKKDILGNVENALEKLSDWRTVYFKYKNDEQDTPRKVGLIAQDVQATVPEAVSVEEDEIGTLQLRYSEVIPVLVKAIQEQQAIITDLKARIETLESK